MDTIKLTFYNPIQAHNELRRVWEVIKPILLVGKKLSLTVSYLTRSVEQNSMFHGICNDCAKQKEWEGRKWSIEEWKRLLTASWMRTKGVAPLIVPSIDGESFDVLYRRTSELSVPEMSELTEYALAWAIDAGVNITCPGREEFIDKETGEIITVSKGNVCE